MISREELQQVKDYTRANKEVVNTDRCLWGDRGGFGLFPKTTNVSSTCSKQQSTTRGKMRCEK